jgi:hypothetical protein
MEVAMKIEDAALEARNLRSVILATYDAIYNGADSYREFEGALHTVFDMAHDHMEHMEALTEEAFALAREG